MPGMNNVRERGDDVSLADLLLELLRFYREFGRLLVPVALLFALVAGAAVALVPVYSAVALLDTAQMPLDQWRRLQPMLSDRHLVAASLAEAKLPAGQRDRLLMQFQQPRYWSSRVSYRSTVGRDDIREQINIDPKKVGALGLEVSLLVRDDAAASQQFELIAQHIRQVMWWSDLREYLDKLQLEVLEQRARLQIEQIRQQFSIEQNLKQVQEMQKLLQQYPELRRNGFSTVVSVGDGGGKYLSPLAQTVALQSTVAETRASLRKGQRELEQLDWKQRYLGRVDARMRSLYSGTALADWLRLNQHEMFPPDATVDAAQQQVGSEIQMTLGQLQYKAEQLRYKAQPAISAAPVPSRRPWLVALAAFLCTLGVLSLALASYAALRRRDSAAQLPWSAHGDPLFAWLPAGLRRRLLPERASIAYDKDSA